MGCMRLQFFFFKISTWHLFTGWCTPIPPESFSKRKREMDRMQGTKLLHSQAVLSGLPLFVVDILGSSIHVSPQFLFSVSISNSVEKTTPSPAKQSQTPDRHEASGGQKSHYVINCHCWPNSAPSVTQRSSYAGGSISARQRLVNVSPGTTYALQERVEIN